MEHESTEIGKRASISWPSVLWYDFLLHNRDQTLNHQKRLLKSLKMIKTMTEHTWNNSFVFLVLRVYKVSNEPSGNSINTINRYNTSTESLQQRSINILGEKSFTNSPVYFSYSKLLSYNATLGCQVSLGIVIITKYIYICASVNKFNDVG